MDIENYSINKPVNGGFETRFCYLIDKQAEIAGDSETGEFEECYTEYKLTHKNEIPFDEYQKIHSGTLRNDLAKLMVIPEAYLTPVTAEEYDRETVEED
jgi:hypothetical protein